MLFEAVLADCGFVKCFMPQLRFHSVEVLDKIQLFGFSTQLMKPGKATAELTGVGVKPVQNRHENRLLMSRVTAVMSCI